jgi:enoyl-[acyl-carrier-protein] reductase (NADH)
MRSGGADRQGAARPGNKAELTRAWKKEAAQVLAGRKALVIGVANDQSIAYGCAKAFRAAGADLAITWLNDKARPHVEPLAIELGAEITAPLDVTQPGEMEKLFETIVKTWGQLDLLVHSIAFAPKEDLQGGLLDCSAEGFARAMDISCSSASSRVLILRIPTNEELEIARSTWRIAGGR